ncbi:P-loop containing nucleoside triphosphate hydrolase protein [Piedraia hortae CBS 480.64]|uniref:Origin recognition complex subunit 4 n=1 Tax=Piedraia hortae CBS 480.64 TaxID=1314780 RepID=A0A6A7CBT5_9PEZI|nr:P-loop containing nucleoside triphosphate hydrolase protein [Piedraia hortae CBS 480.64]
MSHLSKKRRVLIDSDSENELLATDTPDRAGSAVSVSASDSSRPLPIKNKGFFKKFCAPAKSSDVEDPLKDDAENATHYARTNVPTGAPTNAPTASAPKTTNPKAGNATRNGATSAPKRGSRRASNRDARPSGAKTIEEQMREVVEAARREGAAEGSGRVTQRAAKRKRKGRDVTSESASKESSSAYHGTDTDDNNSPSEDKDNAYAGNARKSALKGRLVKPRKSQPTAVTSAKKRQGTTDGAIFSMKDVIKQTGKMADEAGAKHVAKVEHSAAKSAAAEPDTTRTAQKDTRRHVRRGYVFSTKPIKTFEDEIKELEEKARQEAAKEVGTKQVASKAKPRKSLERKLDAELRQSARGSASNKPKSIESEPSLEGELQKKTPSPDRPPTVGSVEPDSCGPLPILEPDELAFIRSFILAKLTGQAPMYLIGLEEEHVKVEQLLQNTIKHGESNSMLLVGSRGSGKTATINSILRQFSAKDFYTIRLNGFVQTDDKLALREIWRQLGEEMSLDTVQPQNYADALTTLLALLSHRTEQGLEEKPGQITKSIIFIIDEFDLFAAHPRQTLLYNLFDIAQSRKAPIAVLGCTTRIDIVEMLEKRVKSRFSHRIVHFGLAKCLAVFQTMCDSALEVERKEKWDKVLDKMYADIRYKQMVRRIYFTTKFVPEFMSAMFVPISQMDTTKAQRSDELAETILASFQPRKKLIPDSKLTLLSSLSTLQMALLISAARLTAIRGMIVFKFDIAYEEYKSLALRAKLQEGANAGATARVSKREVAKKAWDELVDSELLMEDSYGSIRADIKLQEIGRLAPNVTDLGVWERFCKEV